MVQGPSVTDRLDGVNEGIGKKAPVRLRSIGNITLSGEQTIDGIAAVADDRVLVMAQTDQTTNGIYNVSTGTWERALDCNGNRDLVKGSMVFVNAGSTYQQTMWVCTTANPITIDTDNIVFVQWSGGGGFPNATYWTVTDEDATLPNSRMSAAGSGITLTDGGAGSTITVAVTENVRTAAINAIIDGGGAAIGTGVQIDGIPIPFNCTIQSVTLTADQSGSIVLDIWKDVYGSYPPTVADTITASAKPTISSTTKATDATLTGWVTAITAGDILRINVDSCSSIERVNVSIKVLKT